MKNPVFVVPGAMEALHAVNATVDNTKLPALTKGLVELRASQINACSVCVDMHWRMMKKLGETDDRIHAVAAWRHTPYFTAAERAALALAEAVTRIADREDAISDEVWAEVARHYDEPTLGALLLAIANINTWNRLNVAVAQIVGDWKP